MKKEIILALSMVLLLSIAAYGGDSIYYIKFDGTIHNAASSYLTNAVKTANENNAELIVLQINTPGGYAKSMEEIIQAIMASKAPVAVYVGPSGAKAASAGFFIAMAADIVIMAPGTNMGAAHPVMVPLIPADLPSSEDDKEKEKEKKSVSQQDIMAEKVLKDSIAYMKSVVKSRGRNAEAAIKAVEESESYSAYDAYNTNLCEFICLDINDIIDELDGYLVKRLDGEIHKLDLQGKQLITIEMSWKDRFMSALANPTLIFLLLIIAAVGIYAEFTHPGIIFPGVIGFISLILFFFAAQILPIRLVGVLLILVAVILFILELKITSFGLLTVAGIICMIIGGILLIDSPLPEFRVPLLVILPGVAAVALIVSFLTALVVKSLRKKVVTGDAGMIGEEAVVVTALTPEGKVFLMGEIWDASADSNIKKDEKVIVEKVEGMKLTVRKKS